MGQPYPPILYLIWLTWKSDVGWLEGQIRSNISINIFFVFSDYYWQSYFFLKSYCMIRGDYHNMKGGICTNWWGRWSWYYIDWGFQVRFLVATIYKYFSSIGCETFDFRCYAITYNEIDSIVLCNIFQYKTGIILVIHYM